MKTLAQVPTRQFLLFNIYMYVQFDMTLSYYS